MDEDDFNSSLSNQFTDDPFQDIINQIEEPISNRKRNAIVSNRVRDEEVVKKENNSSVMWEIKTESEIYLEKLESKLKKVNQVSTSTSTSSKSKDLQSQFTMLHDELDFDDDNDDRGSFEQFQMTRGDVEEGDENQIEKLPILSEHEHEDLRENFIVDEKKKETNYCQCCTLL